LQSEYGIGRHGRFVVEYPSGSLTFFEGERPRVVASIVPIATHVPESRSLKWAWANAQFPPEVRAAASRTKELEKVTGHRLFVEEAVDVDEDTAWDIAALACTHLAALGVYRVPHGKVHSYVLILEVRRVA
jgi:hypothetical protein